MVTSVLNQRESIHGTSLVLLLDEADWSTRNTVIQPNAHRRMVCVSNQQGVHFP